MWWKISAITNMVKNHHLSKSIMDASWGAFLALLEAKAESAGHQVLRVNPRFTSQKCHQCGAIVQKSLSVRTHICPCCGYVADRDVNAAKNILSKARAWPSGTVSAGSPVELRSPRLEPWGVVTSPPTSSSSSPPQNTPDQALKPCQSLPAPQPCPPEYPIPMPCHPMPAQAFHPAPAPVQTP